MATSRALRSATSARVSSEANASLPTMEMDVLGSKDTSWKPGPMYFITLLMASPPPQATSLSKYWGRIRMPSTRSSPPRQYTADMDFTTGWSGSMSAMVRSRATVEKGSAEAILNTLMDFTRALWAM